MTVTCQGAKVVSVMCLLEQWVIGEGFQLQFTCGRGALQPRVCAGLGKELLSNLGMTATMKLPFLQELWHATNSLTYVKSNYCEGWNLISPVYLRKEKKSFLLEVLFFLIFLLYSLLPWKVLNWLLFVLQMDPVQKAVINHTFGVSIPPKKKQVISCNVCQLRFNSDVSIAYLSSF